MSEICCKFSGEDNALLISLEAAFDRGSGAKIVAQGEKLGGICVVCWWGLVWGEVLTPFKKRAMELPISVLQNHISQLSTIPFSLQQCNIKKSHWHQLDFDQWMIAGQRMPRSCLGFHKFTTTNSKSVWCLIFLDPNFQKQKKMSDTFFLCFSTHSTNEGFQFWLL